MPYQYFPPNTTHFQCVLATGAAWFVTRIVQLGGSAKFNGIVIGMPATVEEGVCEANAISAIR